jgi:hypothetical protein
LTALVGLTFCPLPRVAFLGELRRHGRDLVVGGEVRDEVECRHALAQLVPRQLQLLLPGDLVFLHLLDDVLDHIVRRLGDRLADVLQLRVESPEILGVPDRLPELTGEGRGRPLEVAREPVDEIGVIFRAELGPVVVENALQRATGRRHARAARTGRYRLTRVTKQLGHAPVTGGPL